MTSNIRKSCGANKFRYRKCAWLVHDLYRKNNDKCRLVGKAKPTAPMRIENYKIQTRHVLFKPYNMLVSIIPIQCDKKCYCKTLKKHNKNTIKRYATQIKCMPYSYSINLGQL